MSHKGQGILNDQKIGIIASDIEMRDSIVRLFEEDVAKGKILIDVLDYDKIEKQGEILERQGARAIVARSGGYRHTVGKVGIPVIHLKISTLDILYAIQMGKRISDHMVLVLSDLEYFCLDDWKDLIQTKVAIERFSEREEIPSIISRYKTLRKKVVIIGGGLSCRFAQEINLDHIHIGASDESVKEAVQRAWELVDSVYEQKYINEVLNTTLDGVHDSVIVIDNQHRIISINEKAIELLKNKRHEVLKRPIVDVLPEFHFLTEALDHKINKTNEIINLKNMVIAANISLLNVDQRNIGAFCSFQDITKLQSLEKKIRYELNKKGLVAKYKFEDVITVSTKMQEVLERAMRIGQTDNTVLVYGESGTGKEMIVQGMHHVSKRLQDPFVAINCAAIAENLLESELFGYEEGAFTGARKGGKAGLFELAHGGTIFLDEINSISLNLQAKLLRVLEEKEVMRIGSDYVIPLDVRIIAASSEDLKRKVEAGRFRNDLFYRLSILELRIPPLRERTEDIIPIFKHYAGRDALELEKVIEQKGELLKRYNWPGNVRELRNVALRYSILGELEPPNDEESEFYNNREDLISDHIIGDEEKDNLLNLKEINRYIEHKVIQMLEKRGFSKNDIAAMLGISRSTLWNKKNTDQ